MPPAGRPDVCHAPADDGTRLPVIDVTHPAFAYALSPEQRTRAIEKLNREEDRRQRLPRPLRALIPWILRRSPLGRGLLDAHGGVLPSLVIYTVKLGPENLGRPWGRLDRAIAGALPSRLARLRLEDVARLLAAGLAPSLRARPGRPLHLVDIAGGPAADAWNALLVLREHDAALLEGRATVIHVLDRDAGGPAFGERCLAALRAPGGPLARLDIALRYVSYDWSDQAPLRALLADVAAGEAVVAASSEGGLFDYGRDEDIVANLRVLAEDTPADAVVVGSVTREDSPLRYRPGFALRPHTRDGFLALAAQAGWRLADERDAGGWDVRLARG